METIFLNLNYMNTTMKSLMEDVYVRCMLLSFLGWLLNLAKNLNNVWKESKIHNLQFSYWSYFKDEKIALLINAIMQTMVMIYIPDILKFTGKEWAATLLIGVCAFFGSEFVTLVFGSARALVKAAIDKKTTERDEFKNEVGVPTPIK